LLTNWYGFEDQDDTWENAKRMMEDVPELVKTYCMKENGNDVQKFMKEMKL
jgi:hypothetical protein